MKPYNGFSGAQRQKAADWIRAGVAAGRLTAATACKCCGQTRGVLHHHAEDYSEPFGPHTVRSPLCWACHLAWHCRFRYPVGVRTYIRLVAGGWRANAIASFPVLDRYLQNDCMGMPGVEGSHELTGYPWRMMNTEAAMLTGRDWFEANKA